MRIKENITKLYDELRDVNEARSRTFYAHFLRNKNTYKRFCQRSVFLWFCNKKNKDVEGRSFDLDLGPTVDSVRSQSESIRNLMSRLTGDQQLSPRKSHMMATCVSSCSHVVSVLPRYSWL